MRWIIRVHDAQPFGGEHIATLYRSGNSRGAAPEESVSGRGGFDFSPDALFEGGVFGALFLDYGCIGDGAGDVRVQAETASAEERGQRWR